MLATPKSFALTIVVNQHLEYHHEKAVVPILLILSIIVGVAWSNWIPLILYLVSYLVDKNFADQELSRQIHLSQGPIQLAPMACEGLQIITVFASLVGLGLQ